MNTPHKGILFLSVVLMASGFSVAAWSVSPDANNDLSSDDAERADEARDESPVNHIAESEAAFEDGLTLEECIELGLRNNLGLRSASYAPKAAAAAIIEAKSEFDVVYSLAYAFIDKDFPSATVLDGAAVLRQKSHQVETKLVKKLLTGGSIEFGFYTNHQKSNSIFASVNPRSDSNFSLSIVQRLLRGFGLNYNRSRIDTSENEGRIENIRFEGDVLDVTYKIERAYWEYVGYVHDLRVCDESIKTAERTLADVEKRLAIGKVLELERLEAEEYLENQRLVRLITAQRVDDSREALVRLIEPYSDNVRWEMEIFVPGLLGRRDADIDMDKNVNRALQNRHELLQAELIIENLKIQERVAKNEMLPAFNLAYEVTWHGLDYQTYDSVRDISIDRYVTDQLTAYFEYPLFNRGAKNRHLQAHYNLERAMVDVDSLRMDVTMGVRAAVRNVEVVKNAIDVAKRSFELAARKLKVENERYKVGQTTLRDKLEYEREMVRAKTLHIRAQIDYELAVNHLERVTAATLEKYDIDVRRDEVAQKALAAARNHIGNNAKTD